MPSGLPAGFIGYYELYDGAPTPAPACSAGYASVAYTGYAGIMADPAVCGCACGPVADGCSIGAPLLTDATCGGTDVCACGFPPPSGFVGGCYGGMSSGGFYTCGGSTCGPQAPGATTCSTGTQPCNVSVQAPASTPSGGACNAIASKPMLPPPTWSEEGVACGVAPSTASCAAAGDVCVPTPATPFGSGVCIMATGVVTCPSAGFTAQHVFYGSDDDTRACSACTCGAPAGGTCTVTYELFDTGASSPVCTGTPVATVTSGSCVDLATNPSVDAVRATAIGQGGSCAPQGGQATGTVTPAGPTTFCCMP